MRCILGGVSCDAVGPNGWIFTTGPHPNVQSFEMDKDKAHRLLGGNPVVELVIEDGGQAKTIKNLYLIGEGPSSAPMFATVQAADLRWRWPRTHVKGAYNIRRRTGDKTLLVEANSLVQLAQVVDDFQFAAWSLNRGKKWRPREIIRDVFEKLQSGGPFPFTIEDDITDELEVNEVDVDLPGPEAVAMVLNHLPGASLWVDAEGKVIVQSAIGLAEADVIRAAGPEIVGGGHVSQVSYRLTRPEKIVVYFTREQEIRFDSVLEGAAPASIDDRFCQNVVLVTDPQVLLTGVDGIVSQGSWATFDSIFDWWNFTKEIPKAHDVDHDFIQAAFFEDALYNVHVPWGSDEPQPVWMGRIGAIKRDYRQTYRINRSWMDRLHRILPIRAAILDQATGQRGRAQAYTDHCVRLATRNTEKSTTKQLLFKNVSGYSAELSNAEVSPAIVQVLDDQAGIFRLDYHVDPYGLSKEIYPSQMINVPTANVGDKRPRGLSIRVGMFGAFPKLAPDHRMAVVLTCIPAAPNSKAQFYPVTVTPEDVKGLVPGLVINPSLGPQWEIRVDPGVVTARIAWADGHAASAIERSLGVGGQNLNPIEAEQQAQQDAKLLDSLVVNRAHLVAVAQALAAQLWSLMTDRSIGSKTVRNLDVRIRGSIESVSHTIEVDGRVLTTIALPEKLRERNIFALLPEGVRRVLLREVPIGNAS